MQASPQRLDHMRHHGGFSLVELLIVMAVLAAVAGLTLPAMRGPLDKSRLTGAAKQLQAALSKARSLAIREGTAVNFRYEILGDRFVIEREPLPTSSAITVLDDAAGLSGTPSGLTDATTTPETTTPSESTAEYLADDGFVTVLREGTLPTGVIFGSLAVSESPPAAASAPGTVQPVAEASGVTIRRWSDPVRFHPSGRTADQVIRITGQREFFVDVTLRGLTATASYSAPTRIAPAELAPVGAAADVPGLANPEAMGGLP